MMNADKAPAGETTRECIKRLMKRGGYIIVAGGEMAHLPHRYKEHPQVKVWDDNEQGWENREVPTNTRAIAYNGWISHRGAGKLRQAASKLSIPVFPMLKKREILELLDFITSEEPVPTVATDHIPLTEPGDPAPNSGPGYVTKEELLHKPRKGEMATILPVELQATETPSQAARRILPILKDKYSIETNYAALEQAIRFYRLKQAGGRKTATPPVLPVHGGTAARSSVVSDAFAEGERLLREARTAIDLFLDFLPKLRKERADLTSRLDKIRKELGD